MQTKNFEENTIIFKVKKDTYTFDDITKIIKCLLLKRERNQK
jgi:hypothetical protein